MDGLTPIDKKSVDKLIENGKIYATRDGIQSGNSSNVNADYFGDNNSKLYFDSEGRIIEVQDGDSTSQGTYMGWANTDDLTKESSSSNNSNYYNGSYRDASDIASQPAKSSTSNNPNYYNGSYRDASDIASQPAKSSTSDSSSYYNGSYRNQSDIANQPTRTTSQSIQSINTGKDIVSKNGLKSPIGYAKSVYNNNSNSYQSPSGATNSNSKTVSITEGTITAGAANTLDRGYTVKSSTITDANGQKHSFASVIQNDANKNYNTMRTYSTANNNQSSSISPSGATNSNSKTVSITEGTITAGAANTLDRGYTVNNNQVTQNQSNIDYNTMRPINTTRNANYSNNTQSSNNNSYNTNSNYYNGSYRNQSDIANQPTRSSLSSNNATTMQTSNNQRTENNSISENASISQSTSSNDVITPINRKGVTSSEQTSNNTNSLNIDLQNSTQNDAASGNYATNASGGQP